MAVNYNEIFDSEIDPDSPITTSLMFRLRDNPIAIAEGAAGAPKIVLGALSTQLFAPTDSAVLYQINAVGPVWSFTTGWITIGDDSEGLQNYELSATSNTTAGVQEFDHRFDDNNVAPWLWLGFHAGFAFSLDISDVIDGVIYSYTGVTATNAAVGGVGFNQVNPKFGGGFVTYAQSVGSGIAQIEARLSGNSVQVRFNMSAVVNAGVRNFFLNGVLKI